MDSATVALFNQLTLAAAAIVACGFLWRRLVATQDAANKTRDEFEKTVVYDLKARIMVLEGMMGFRREEGIKYTPPANDKEVEMLVDLDGKLKRP